MSIDDTLKAGERIGKMKERSLSTIDSIAMAPSRCREREEVLVEKLREYLSELFAYADTYGKHSDYPMEVVHDIKDRAYEVLEPESVDYAFGDYKKASGQ